MYTYIVMATKTISIKREPYDALLREEKSRESFTDTILRITKKTGKLSDCFGTLKMTDEEEEAVRAELSKRWHLTQERRAYEVHRNSPAHSHSKRQA